MPDISFNGDPDTGHTLFYTLSVFGFEEFTFSGGTRFVAPQLIGVSALIDQYVGGRFGLMTIPLYQLAKSKAPMKAKMRRSM